MSMVTVPTTNSLRGVAGGSGIWNVASGALDGTTLHKTKTGVGRIKCFVGCLRFPGIIVARYEEGCEWVVE